MDQRTLYVGIDVAKQTLDTALTLDGKRVMASKKTANDPAGHRILEHWIRAYAVKKGCPRTHCCIESTGRYSMDIAAYLQEQEGVIVSIVNPALPKAFGKSLLLRTKTDQVSAALLAFYVAAVKPEPTPQPPEELKELKALVRHLAYLTSRRSQEKTHLESITHVAVMVSVKELIREYDRQIEEVEQKIAEHLKNHPDLKGKIQLLASIPGIGDATARLLLCEFHVQQGQKLQVKAQTAHAGLAPGKRESGTSVKGKSRICKLGNSRIRTGLYFPTLTVIKHNPLVAPFYQKLIQRGKLPMVAIVACMRKLLAIAIGVLNNGVPFDANWVSRKQAT